jgi:branched-chain amino acid transport system substrate-binding protein
MPRHRRRTSLRLVALLAVTALAFAACGDDDDDGDTNAGGSDTTAAQSSGGTTYALAFAGPLTGPNANLGINIRDGAKVAVDEANKAGGDIRFVLKSFDTQGDPAQAPTVKDKYINDDSIIGIVGPAFSGESKAAGPIFAQAGLNTITASATNPALSENGWKTFNRILGNDATQGPAAAKYIKDVLKADKVFVSDDTSEYGKGLADIVKKDLGAAVAGSDQTAADGKQDDFSATVTKAKASGATVFFYGGYYSNASKLAKQLKDGGFTGQFVAADGVKDDGFIKGAGAAAEGVIVTCPCLPPDQAPDFATAYKKAYNSDPATYSAEAYDAANVFLAGIKAGKTSSEDMKSFISSYDEKGVTKQVKFDAKGEPAEVTVWAYKVERGKIVADQEVK